MAVGIKARHATEFRKCKNDPIYFFNRYCKVVTLDRGVIPFKTFAFQDDIVKSFNKNRHNIIVKARQLGLSTITAAYAVWLIMFYGNQKVFVIATKEDVAKNFIDKCKFLIESMPDWLKIQEVTINKTLIETSKGSKIKAVPTSPDAGRSESINLLIVDEAAFVKDFGTIWTGLKPTMNTGGRAIILSTPNGAKETFWKLYSDAEDNINGFTATNLHWSVHPEHDEKWFAEETKGMSKKAIAQEYECDFQASGDTYLDATIIDWIRELSLMHSPIRRVGPDRNVHIWREPLLGHKYILSADTSRGDAKDFSAFHVIDATAGEIAAEYKGKLPPDRFAELINEIGLSYNTALVCPENNNVGYATIQRLCSLSYPRIYNNKKKTLDIWTAISTQNNIQKPSGDLGIFTTGQKKQIILTKMEELLRNKQIKIYSTRLLKELKTFVWINEHKVGASKGENDDLVMALAIGLWLVDVEEYDQFADEHTKSILDAMESKSIKLDEIISEPSRKDEVNVFLPVAGNGSGFGAPRVQKQVVAKRWNWLFS